MSGSGASPHDPPQNRVFGLSLMLGAIVLFVFLQAREYPLLEYGDGAAVTGNPLIQQGLQWPDAAAAMFRPHLGLWTPLAVLSHLLDVAFYGDWAGGHHQTNIALHAANVLLLYWALVLLTGCPVRAAMVAALFAVHPTRAEPVAWITARPELLGGTFFALTLLAYAWYARGPGFARYLLVLLALLAGLMTHPVLIAVPLVLLLLDWWPLHRFERERATRLLLEKLPLLLVALGTVFLALHAQAGFGEGATADSLSPARRVEAALLGLAHTLFHVFWPVNLAVHHPVTESSPWLAGGAMVLLAALSLLVLLCRRQRYLAVGWFWFLVLILPALLLAHGEGASMAHRLSYLPHIGLFLLFAWGGHALLARAELGQAAAKPLSTLLIATLMLLTWWQVGFWRDTETLLRRALEVTGDNHRVHTALGEALMTQHRFVEALPHLEAALRIAPQDADTQLRLGEAHLELGQVNAALEHLAEAARLAPENRSARMFYGKGLLRIGQRDAAIAQLEAALALDPQSEVLRSLLDEVRATQP